MTYLGTGFFHLRQAYPSIIPLIHDVWIVHVLVAMIYYQLFDLDRFRDCYCSHCWNRQRNSEKEHKTISTVTNTATNTEQHGNDGSTPV
jgi:hypothetical protein